LVGVHQVLIPKKGLVHFPEPMPDKKKDLFDLASTDPSDPSIQLFGHIA
jgi:hypothetical protein